jgi:hypothetical protein
VKLGKKKIPFLQTKVGGLIWKILKKIVGGMQQLCLKRDN